MLQLFYGPGNASLTPHMLLEELGVPYELRLVDRAGGEQQRPEFLKLNPNGLIPVLVDGDFVLYETAAIAMHLADTHPEAQLAPALGTHERAEFYKWIVWMTNTLQTAIVTYFHPDHLSAPDDAAAQASIKQHVEARIARFVDQLDAQLEYSGGPWLLGAQFSALDPYALMLSRWTRSHARPANARPNLGPYLQRVLERPAVRRAFEQEGLEQPWV